MRQRTIHISFTKDNIDLYNELMRESSLSYVPASALIRNYLKSGMKTNKDPLYQTKMKNIQVSNLTYEMLLELSKKKRIKPEAYIEECIKNAYFNRK